MRSSACLGYTNRRRTTLHDDVRNHSKLCGRTNMGVVTFNFNFPPWRVVEGGNFKMKFKKKKESKMEDQVMTTNDDGQ